MESSNPIRNSVQNSNRPYLELVMSKLDENWISWKRRLCCFH